MCIRPAHPASTRPTESAMIVMSLARHAPPLHRPVAPLAIPLELRHHSTVVTAMMGMWRRVPLRLLAKLLTVTIPV